MKLQAVQPQAKKGYRADIDGLRAVAVLSVVFFHINSYLVPGGFIGVDIFFVISGFLITGNILREVEKSHGFSWAEFYRRRALRILPVLFVVILACMLVGHFLMLPADLEKLSWAALAATFASANIYFTYFLDVSYFSTDSSLQPLLHLWSLGVEEQFYFIWPALLLLLMKAERVKRAVLLLAIVAASFVAAELTLPSQPMFSYYMLPTRAGELMVGALLAIGLHSYEWRPSSLQKHIIAALGFGLIIFSLWWIGEADGFPGINALPSTVGAALVILAGQGGAVGLNRLLSFSPVVAIGLISYSLYLWHWPVLAFYRYAFGLEIGVSAAAYLFALMVLLSVISYKFVEKPFRSVRLNFKKVIGRAVFLGALPMVLVVALFTATKGAGLYQLSPDYQMRFAKLEPAPAAFSYPYVCQKSLLTPDVISKEACVLGVPQGGEEPKILLWGDSNAAHYVGMLGAFSEVAGFSFRNIAHSSCPPVLMGAEKYVRAERRAACLSSLNLIDGALNKYDVVVMGASWGSYFANDSGFYRELENTIQSLLDSGKKVVILGQIPRARNIDRSCRQKALKSLMPACSKSEYGGYMPEANERLKELAEKYSRVHYYDANAALCDDVGCKVSLNDNIVYYDSGHFSMDGSWQIGRYIVEHNGVPEVFLSISDFVKRSEQSIQN